jgi:hypothetical protein
MTGGGPLSRIRLSSHSLLARLFCGVAALALAGCAGTSANVRALRMYQREEVTPELLNEHLRQLDEALKLIRRIHQAPYRPGDSWVRALPLDDARAAMATQAIKRSGSLERTPSVLSVYETHARELLERVERTAAEQMPPVPVPPSVPPLPTGPDFALPPSASSESAPGAAQPSSGAAGAPGTPAPSGSDFLPPILPPTLPSAPPPAALPPTLPPVLPPALPAAQRPTSILDALAALDPQFAELGRAFAETEHATKAVAQAVAELEAARTATHQDARTLRQREEAVERAEEALAERSRALEGRVSRPIARAAHTETVVKDAIAVTSVTLRLAMEAAALATVAVAEAATLATRSPREWLRDTSGTAALLRDLPPRVRSIAAELESNVVAIQGLLGALARVEAIDVSDTVGFAYRDGLVDEIVGFTWDSVHLEANAGGEAFFYNALASAEKSTGGGAAYDYTGRVYRLEYDVDPIVLASARMSLSFDWTRLADAAGLKLGYATNRVYKSGGDIQQGSLARELGITNAWSDALDAALSVAGVKASVRIAQFTSGTVDLVQVADGSSIATFPFAFQLKQIDLGYDFATRIESPLRSLTLTFGYFDYTLPRVLYEFENSTPGADSANYVYLRESPPQAVRSRFGMLGLAADTQQPLVGKLLGVLGARIAVGGGPIEYYFLRDETLPDEAGNRDTSKRFTYGFNGGAFLGVRWRLVSAESRLSAHFDATYQALVIASGLGSDDDATAINSGSSDLFHGPTLSLGGAF